VDRDSLIAALERHGTDAASQAALALRAGSTFWVSASSTVPASELFTIWAWRARRMAEDGIVTRKDFKQGLPALKHAGGAPVILGRVGMAEDTYIIFLAADLKSCVAVL
jgi:hypothetical protein